MSHEDHQAKVAELLKDHRFAMFTTRNEHGQLVGRPFTVQEREFDGDLWFIVALDSPAVAQLRQDERVGVTFSKNGNWLSLTGSAAVVDDHAKLEELWSAGVEAWFPDGPSDPNAGLVRFEAAGAEYWDSPGGGVSTVFSFVKSKLTGERMEGDNAKVDL